MQMLPAISHTRPLLLARIHFSALIWVGAEQCKKKQWAWDKVMNGIRIVGRLLLPADVDAYAEEVMAQCTRTNSPIVTIYTSAAFCCLAVGVDESPRKRRRSFIRREFIQKDSIQT